AARSRADAAGRQRRRLPPARRGDAAEPRGPRLAGSRPPARLALERRQRHALGDGLAHAAALDHAAAEVARTDLRSPRRRRRADALARDPRADRPAPGAALGPRAP